MSDQSYSDLATLGQLGVVPGYPPSLPAPAHGSPDPLCWNGTSKTAASIRKPYSSTAPTPATWREPQRFVDELKGFISG